MKKLFLVAACLMVLTAGCFRSEIEKQLFDLTIQGDQQIVDIKGDPVIALETAKGIAVKNVAAKKLLQGKVIDSPQEPLEYTSDNMIGVIQETEDYYKKRAIIGSFLSGAVNASKNFPYVGGLLGTIITTALAAFAAYKKKKKEIELTASKKINVLCQGTDIVLNGVAAAKKKDIKMALKTLQESAGLWERINEDRIELGNK